MNKNSPKISVIIPTFNRAKLLPRTVKSVLNQTFHNFEIIIVDDGSTDNTKEVIHKFLKKDKRIKYLHQENKGVAVARNLGIKNASGYYIAFLDSDDEWLEDKLEKQIELIRRDTTLDFVGCGRILIDDDGKREYKKVPSFNYKDISQEEILDLFLQRKLAGDIILTSGIILKRSIFDAVGFFDPNLGPGEDTDMWLRTLSNGFNFGFIATPLFKYYIGGDNHLSRDLRDNSSRRLYFLNKHLDIFKVYPKGFAKQLRRIGTSFIFENKVVEARKYYKQAIKVDSNPRDYFLYTFSFFSKNIYKVLLKIKDF